MVKQHNNQAGFSALIGILAVIVIAGVGVGGWYVLDQGKDDGKKPTSTSSQQSSTEDTEDETPQPSKYLDITEWGLRITLPENLQRDISYSVYDGGTDPQIIFTSKTITDSDLSCADIPTGNKKLVAGFYRYEIGGGIEQEDPPAFKTVANAKYYWRGTSCQEALDRGEGTAEQKQLVADLKEAIVGTLEPIPSN